LFCRLDADWARSSLKPPSISRFPCWSAAPQASLLAGPLPPFRVRTPPSSGPAT
jgi:hypothetical protein